MSTDATTRSVRLMLETPPSTVHATAVKPVHASSGDQGEAFPGVG